MIRILLLGLLVATVYGGGSGSKGSNSGGRRGPPGGFDRNAFKCDESQKEDCSASFQTVADCLTANFKSKGDKMEEKKSEIVKFFTESGCQDPTTLHPEEKAKFEQRGQCFKALAKKGFEEVKKCVEAAITDVKLPTVDFSNVNFGQPHLSPELIKKVIAEACGNDSAKIETVSGKIREAINNSISEFKAGQDQFCDSQIGCVNNTLSKYCKCKFGQTFVQSAKCAMQLFKKKSGNFTADDPECQGVELSQQDFGGNQEMQQTRARRHSQKDTGEPDFLRKALCGGFGGPHDEQMQHGGRGENGAKNGGSYRPQ